MINEKPLVSVIIPIYKVEKYLSTCVESVINQTYKNIEIILVDDGSPDNCPKICDEYAEKDNRIKVIHKQNGGLSDARNAGIKIAEGDYFSFVDSDDVIHPQMLEFLSKTAVEKKVQVVTCGFSNIPEDCNGNDNSYFYTFENAFAEKCKEVALIEYVKKVYWTTAWAKLYSRKLFEKIEYPVGRLHEDEFTTYKLLYSAGKICMLNLPFYYYRIRSSSITANITEKNLTDTIDAFVEKIEFFLNKDEKELAEYSYLELLVYFTLLFVKPRKNASNKKIENKCKTLLKKHRRVLTIPINKIK